MSEKFNLRRMKELKLRDMGVASAFVGAVAVLVFVAMYVFARLQNDRAYRAKWQDYNDCGWA
jgi:hypothetical protein